MPALYLVVVSALVAIIAYRTYGAFLAAKVATLDDLRVTPAHTQRDGRDYVPTLIDTGTRVTRYMLQEVGGMAFLASAPERVPEAVGL